MANEAQTAVKFLDEVLAACAEQGFDTRFFAVLDRVSTDGTLGLLQEREISCPDLTVVWAPENTCVVDAYVRGYEAAINSSADWILEIDAGYSHQPSEIHRLLQLTSEGYDCLFGSRLCKGGSFENTSFRRQLISRGGTVLANLVLGTKLSDMTSGFQLFSRNALQTILAKTIRSRGPFFQTEMKFHSRQMKVIEVPISYSNASHTVGNAAIMDSFVGLARLFKLRLAGRV